MIDTLSNLLFRCSHRRLTRPVTPVSKAGEPHGDTYVVCLDCGKQFGYDTREMKVGKPIQRSEDRGVLPPNMPRPRPSKLKVALWAAAVPLGILIGSSLRKKPDRVKPVPGPTETTPDPAEPKKQD